MGITIGGEKTAVPIVQSGTGGGVSLERLTAETQMEQILKEGGTAL